MILRSVTTKILHYNTVGEETGLQQVYHHIPLSSVANEVIGQVGNQPVIYRQICMLYGQLQVVVALVQLIPEE